jgi:hypothetical protein
LVFSRGTKDFTLEVSYDNTNWNMVVADTLASVKDYDLCELPLETFDAPAHGRYIRFTYLTYYGSWGGGLNYISWEFLE